MVKELRRRNVEKGFRGNIRDFGLNVIWDLLGKAIELMYSINGTTSSS